MTSFPPPYEHPSPPPARHELPAGIDRPPPATRGHVPEGTPPREDLPAWPAWTPFAAMLLTLVIAIAGATVITVVAQLAGMDISAKDTPPGVQIGGTVIQDVALIVSALVFAKVTDGSLSAWQFGLRRVRLGPAVGWLVLVWVIFIALSAVYATLVNAPETSNQAEELGADNSTLNLIAVAILVTVIAPLAEEIFFRGFMFTALRRWIGWVGGGLATAAVFAVIHLGSVDAVFLPPLLLLGFLLCVLYHRTGSLLPCLALHALNNGLALGASQHFSALGTVATMLGATTVVVSIGLLAANSRRLNADTATA
jgi:membrane protease YdiL (CAAX protease family)